MNTQHALSLTAAICLKAGQTLWVRNTQSPRGTQIVMGEHFDFLPPYFGRPFPAGSGADLSRYGKLTAMVDLLLSVQNGHATPGGVLVADSVNHVRLARATHYPHGIAGDKAHYGHELSLGARDSGKPIDYVVGGPTRAAVYADELCVSNFRKVEGRPDFPDSFIINVQEVADVTAAFKRAAREKFGMKTGDKRADPTQFMTPYGEVKVHKVGQGGKLEIQADSAGRVFGLKLSGKPQVWVTVGQTRLTVGEQITDNPIREALGIPRLESMTPSAPARPEAGKANVGLMMEQALQSKKPNKPAAAPEVTDTVSDDSLVTPTPTVEAVVEEETVVEETPTEEVVETESAPAAEVVSHTEPTMGIPLGEAAPTTKARHNETTLWELLKDQVIPAGGVTKAGIHIPEGPLSRESFETVAKTVREHVTQYADEGEDVEDAIETGILDLLAV